MPFMSSAISLSVAVSAVKSQHNIKDHKISISKYKQLDKKAFKAF